MSAQSLWVCFCITASVALHALATLVYSYDFRFAVMALGSIPTGLLCFWRMRIAERAEYAHLSGAATFSLGELFFTVVATPVPFLFIPEASRNRFAASVAVWMWALSALYISGLIGASRRGIKNVFGRAFYSFCSGSLALGLGGLGTTALFMLVFNISPAAMTTPLRGDYGSDVDSVIFTALRAQLLFALPQGVLSMLLFNKFFPILTSNTYYTPSSVPDLAARMREKRNNTPQ